MEFFREILVLSGAGDFDDDGRGPRGAVGDSNSRRDDRGVPRRGAVPTIGGSPGVAQRTGLSGVWLQAFDRAGGARHGPIPGTAGSVPMLQWRLPRARLWVFAGARVAALVGH